MSWIYTEAGLSVFVMSKWIQRKPMSERDWKEPTLMVVVVLLVLGGLGFTLGVDTTGWR